jgi:hypothetical protein
MPRISCREFAKASSENHSRGCHGGMVRRKTDQFRSSLGKVASWLRKLSWILVGSVIGANMGFKLFVALRLEVAHHLLERLAFRRTGGLEPPSTFGTTKTPKTLQINPYQLPAHGCLCRCANEYQRAVVGIKTAVYIRQF